MTTKIDIQFPTGRLVGGSLYEPRDKDAEGKPLVTKTGPDAGKPRVDFFIAVAIPKAGEQQWAQTVWGQQILAVGAAAFPQQYQTPAFAWKIEDGDSAVPNKKGRKPVDNEGYKGHWVLKFSGGKAPKIYQQTQPGTYVELIEPNAVKLGYWIVMNGNVVGNGSGNQPGIYLNHRGVLLIRPDAEIYRGPDANAMFAGAPVTQAPVGAAPSAMPVMPAMPLPAAVVPLAPPVAPAMPTAVAPNPAFLAPPVPIAPPLPPVAPVPAGPALTPKGVASGYTYDQYRSSGWTDDQLRQNGLIA